MVDKDKEQERKDIMLENNTATWDLRADGAILGTYVGTFRFRCFLTPLQQIAANREYRVLLGDNPTLTPEHESFLAYALTQLKYRIISAPPFWAQANSIADIAGDLPDENIISAVLDAAFGAEIKYKNSLKKKKGSALKRAKKAASKITDQLEEDSKAEKEADEQEDQ